MRRTEIKGTLRTITPLCIGSGQSWADYCIENPEYWGTPIRPQFIDGDNTQLVVRDGAGNPFIPGSALKNAIRRSLCLLRDNSAGVSEDHIRKLVGEASGPEESVGGCLIVRSAYLSSESINNRTKAASDNKHLPWHDAGRYSFIEPGVTINRRTGAAQSGRLFAQEFVTSGIVFDVRLLIDDPENDKLLPEIIMKALAVLNQNFTDTHVRLISIGAGAADGCGAVEWNYGTDAVQQLQFRAKPEPIRNFDNKLKVPMRLNGMTVGIRLNLSFRGPFLVKNSAYRSSKKEVDHIPRQSAAGGAMLPASGFRGVLRSAIERIVHTLNSAVCAAPDELNSSSFFGIDFDGAEADDDAEADARMDLVDSVTRALHMLLGSTNCRCRLQISDFVSVQKSKTIDLQMVGVDRLTGAVAPGKTFSVRAFDSPVLSGSMLLNLPHGDCNAIAIGLMILAIRDLLEGDLAFGAGSYRGFGACTATITAVHVTGLPVQGDLRSSLGLVNQADIDEATLNQLIASWIQGKADSSALDQIIDTCLDSLNCLNGESQHA